eukprot:720956-Rhodomonas_salina.1
MRFPVPCYALHGTPKAYGGTAAKAYRATGTFSYCVRAMLSLTVESEGAQAAAREGAREGERGEREAKREKFFLREDLRAEQPPVAVQLVPGTWLFVFDSALSGIVIGCAACAVAREAVLLPAGGAAPHSAAPYGPSDTLASCPTSLISCVLLLYAVSHAPVLHSKRAEGGREQVREAGEEGRALRKRLEGERAAREHLALQLKTQVECSAA